MTSGAIISSFQPAIRCRISLVHWAHEGNIKPASDTDSEIKKTLQITRINGTTKKTETYTTERPDNYKTNQRMRLLDIWCRLRAFAGVSSVIQQYPSQYKEMTAFCECSLSKLKAALKQLKEMEWIDMNEYCLRVHSEKRVYALCGLDYNKKIDRLYYKPPKRENEKTTFYWLYVADIDDNRHRQAYKFHKATMQTPETKLWVHAELSRQGYNPDKATDPMFLAARMNDVYRNSFHGQESEMHEFFVEHRPDINRGVKGMGDAWNTCPQNVSYIKKKLFLQQLAVVQKIGTISSPGWSHNKYCRVMYNFKTKETFQHFCDDIVPREHFKPSETQQFQMPVTIAA